MSPKLSQVSLQEASTDEEMTNESSSDGWSMLEELSNKSEEDRVLSNQFMTQGTNTSGTIINEPTRH